MENIFPNFQENENNQDFDFDNTIINNNNEIDDINEEFPNYQIMHKNYNLSTINNDNNNIHKIPFLFQVKNNSFKNDSNQEKKFLIQFNNKMKTNINTNKNMAPKDNYSKRTNHSIRKIGNNQNSFSYKVNNKNKDVSKLTSSHKNSTIDTENINPNINIKKENYSQLIDIPRSEYCLYRGKNIIFMGRGMETGEYKFTGTKIIMKENLNQNKNIEINEEEIYNEIMRRKNKTKKPKKLQYIILDKFFTTLEYDGKPVKKIIKEEQEQKQIEIEEKEKEKHKKKHKLNIFFKNKNRNKSYDYQDKRMQIPKELQEWKKFKILNHNNSSYGENFRYQNNDYIFPNDFYSKFLFEQINIIRCNPQSYIQYIEKAKEYIIKDISGRLIYNGKIKIALNEGVLAFNKAIDFLKNVGKMKKLEFNQLITIPYPQNENDIKDINYMKYKVDNIIKNGIFINSYWREIIKDPEICFLFMIIDDVGVKSGMRRNDILNPKIKYIGISSKEINGNFACYITLSE